MSTSIEWRLAVKALGIDAGPFLEQKYTKKTANSKNGIIIGFQEEEKSLKIPRHSEGSKET